MGFIDEMKAKAKADKKTIVLPESEDERTYKAAETVLKEGIANVVIVGSQEEIEKNKGSYDISADRRPGHKRQDCRIHRKAGGAPSEEGNDRGAGKGDPPHKLPVLRCHDGEDEGCGRNGVRSMPLHSGHTASLPPDPEDKAGHKACIRFLCYVCAGLRVRRERRVRIC